MSRGPQPLAAAKRSGRYRGSTSRISVVFHKRDRYKRILGKVLVNGADAGLNQIQSGLAWHYKKYEREQCTEDRVAYARAEETARAERRGLWRDPKQVPPWEFRRH